MSIETVLAAGLMRGLTVQDTHEFSLGEWVDYIIEWNNLNIPNDKTKNNASRKASQADFDAF